MIRAFPEREMRRAIRVGGVLLFALLAALRAHAGDPPVSFVPWKVLEAGAAPLKTSFVLFWIPSSPDQMRHSELITSRRLTLYAGRCIGMQVVRADDAIMLVKLRAAETLPLAVLCEGDHEVARVVAESGNLMASEVETMVRDAVDTREAALNSMLDQASGKAASGDKTGAIDLYRQVAAQGCVFPRLAKTAQRALRRLGVK
jgi:hypothetical protein